MWIDGMCIKYYFTSEITSQPLYRYHFYSLWYVTVFVIIRKNKYICEYYRCDKDHLIVPYQVQRLQEDHNKWRRKHMEESCHKPLQVETWKDITSWCDISLCFLLYILKFINQVLIYVKMWYTNYNMKWCNNLNKACFLKQTLSNSDFKKYKTSNNLLNSLFDAF
jgi:hypothetical protein